MTPQEVRKTINYAKFFNSYLTPKNLHFWLISPNACSLQQIKKFISKHPDLEKQLTLKPNPQKTKLVKQKLKKIQRLLSVLELVPAVKLVALTGSLSVNNPKKEDDVDLMIITAPNTLWLTRPLVVLLTSILARRRQPQVTTTGDRVCLNLWLDQLALTVPKHKQNLYTAHEVLQIKPLLDKGGVYCQFIKANSWTKKHLATAYNTILANHQTEQISPRISKCLPRGWLKRILNLLFFHLQHLYMKKKITREYITPHAAFFHPRTPYPQIKKHLKQIA